MVDLVTEAERTGKLEPGKGSWNTPAFPVPKKTPGKFRLVQDLRPLNAVTMKDGHPLPRIGDMVQRQGANLVWSTLDLVDGFHQMPMKVEHRPLTCMSTPKGVRQWTVGLKNAGSQFQRMMEWVLQDHPNADAYIDDVILGAGGSGSTGMSPVEEALRKNFEDMRKVLQTFNEMRLVARFKEGDLFQREVIFCGHILREGRRSPAPGKLMPLQLWELPQTVTDLRGFLGLSNYFAEYVPHYAEYAGPLMGKLRLNRQDGKKGSKLRLIWTDSEIESFHKLKARLGEALELWQVDLDKPFRLHCDASDFAIGAELTQEIDGKWRPVAFFLANWGSPSKTGLPERRRHTPLCLRSKSGQDFLGFQPILVTTDHRALQDWVSEHIDTPSGPRGRRARWHETLSQFDVQVMYIPGPENTVADALSRWAYPASSAREDVSFHGSAYAKAEVT